MKNLKKSISILLVMTMILTTTGLSVFAESDTTPAADSVQTTEGTNTESTNETTEPVVTVEGAAETPSAGDTQADAVTEGANTGEETAPQAQSVETVSPEVVDASGSITEISEADATSDATVTIKIDNTDETITLRIGADCEIPEGYVPQKDDVVAIKYTKDGLELKAVTLISRPEPAVEPSITITKAKLVDYAGGMANILIEWESTGDLTDFTIKSASGKKPASMSISETGDSALITMTPGIKNYRFIVYATPADGGKQIKSKRSKRVATEKAEVEGLESHPSYNAVVLDWEKSDVADHYVVYRGSKKVATVTNKKNTSKYDKNRVLYTVKKLEEFKDYNFKVVAYYDETSKGGYAKVKDQPVRPITYNLVIKRSIPYGELKKHRGNGPSSVSLQAGQTLKAVGFNSGKYVFEYEGSIFNITKQRISGISCTYSKDITYDKISAESYVNRKGLKSKTKNLIWVSTYTQELYVFNGSKGKWKLKKHWAVSTGKASSPSPTGDKFIKEVWKRLPTRHNLSWWTCYSSMNAFHGTFSSWVKKLGNPASGGCIRNKNENAKWLYNNKNIKMGTTVLIR